MIGWTQRDFVLPGNGILGEVVSGFNIDLLSAITLDDVLYRVREYAHGWTPVAVHWQRGLFGVGETLRVTGVGVEQTPTIQVTREIMSAVNSFWMIAGADVQVLVADSVNEPLPATNQDKVSDTIRIAAVAVIVIAIAYSLKQVKDIAL